MKVGKKLFLTTGGLLAALAVVGGVAIYNLAGLNKTTQVIITDPLPGTAKMGGARAALLTITGDVWRHFASSDPAVKSQLESDIRDQKSKLVQQLQEYEKTINSPEDKALFEKIKNDWTRYSEGYPAALDLSRSGKSVEAIAVYMHDADPAYRELRDAFTDGAILNRKLGETLGVESQDRYSRAWWLLMIMLIAGVSGGALAAFLLVSSTTKALRQIVSELAQGAEQTTSAASQISSSSQSLAQGATEQAASLEETSASSEEISSMARKNTDNSQTAVDLVTSSQQRFLETNRSLEQTVAAMDEIQAQSGKISKIIKVIDEIAFQTNILALNAAVEAARAGEAGMGFAVVADEVRNLAQRCAQAAKDTAQLIDESISKSNDGKTRVDDVAVSIRTVTEEAGKVKTLVDEVNLSSQEQARGMQEVGKALVQMEQVTQRSAASAEECASAAEELNAQSQAVRQIVTRLIALVGGGVVAARSERREPAIEKVVTPVHTRHERPSPVQAVQTIPLDDFKDFN